MRRAARCASCRPRTPPWSGAGEPGQSFAWQTFHTIPSAVKAWRSIPFCPTLLTHPTSKAPADVNRRAAVRARVLDYNEVLAQVCAEYPRCTTDGGATFRLPVTEATYSTHDYWHPNIAGQAALAALAWETLDF